MRIVTESDAELTYGRLTRRYVSVYLLLVAVPTVGAATLAWWGRGEAARTVEAHGGAGHLTYRLLIATATVVALAALGGAVARRLGQPRVIGEIVSGVALGPSALGAVLPELQSWLFPTAVLPHLDVLAQFGVVLFMFLVGCELAPDSLRRNGLKVLVVGHASLGLPLLAGVAVAWYLYQWYPPQQVGRLSFLLFVGVCFAITAVPVLARILSERGLLETRLGAIGIASAGVGDVTAWILLMVVVALSRGSSALGAVTAIAWLAGLAVVMVYGVGPVLSRLIRHSERSQRSRLPLYTGILCMVLVSALTTDWIGVHPIFGAFLAGAILPHGSPVVRELTGKIEGVTLWLLLPLFFVNVGLHTSFAGFSGGLAWAACALVTVVAVLAKVTGTAVAARATGSSWHEALSLGAMMNCRGLTELVVLSLGVQLGILQPALFTVFVVMALVTTMMTGPLLGALARRAAADAGSGGRIG